MATLATLRSLVSNIVQDSSFDNTDIDGYLNRGVSEIAGGLQSTLGSFITPSLPELFSISTVTTDTSLASVSMPATYHRNLQFVSNSSGQEIEIYNSMIEFAEDYPLMDGSGSVKSVVVQGNTLYYQDIPTVAETLTLHFYRLPVDMSASDGTPDGIPLHLQVPLLVNYAGWQIFQLIEDGMEGQGVNTIRYKTFFNEALRTLELSIPFDARSLYLGD